MLLYPFSNDRFALNLVFIIDPYVTALFLIPLIWIRFLQKKNPYPAIISIAIFLLYLSIAFINHTEVKKIADTKGTEMNLVFKRTEAYPAPLSPFSWMTVSEDNDGYYILRKNLLKRERGNLERYEKQPIDRYVEASMKEDVVKTYLWFADFPLISSSETEGFHIVEYFDLRFYTYPPRKPFLLRLLFDKDGMLIRKEGVLELPVKME